jgi:hypothetical protein
MKTATIIASLLLIAGLYMEYQKDSSFASIDSGSILMGAGGALLVTGFF